MPSATSPLKQLQTIIEVQARVNAAALELDSFMQEVVDTVGDLTGAKGAVIELVDGEDMVYRCASKTLPDCVGMRLKRIGSLSGRCVAQAEVLRCDDADTDPRVDRAACRRVGVRSMVCTPLFQRGQPVGVLKVMASEPNAFDEYDVQTLGLMAGALGAALGKQLAFDAKNQVEAALRASEAQLQTSEARMRALLHQANDAVMSMNEFGVVTEWNHAAELLFGWTSDEALGQEAVELMVPPNKRAKHRTNLARYLDSKEGAMVNQRAEMQAMHRSGQTMLIEVSLSTVKVGDGFEFLCFMHDIAERKKLELQLQQMAREDALTGLANRRAFMESVERALARANRHDHSMALLYMDMNGFKQINDVHGHEAGDRALREFAHRLQQVVRRTDTVARLGGDEFAILAEGISDPDEALALADKIVHSLLQPMTQPAITLRTSIGVSIHEGQSDASSWLREADAAMYEEKRRARAALAGTGRLVISSASV